MTKITKIGHAKIFERDNKLLVYKENSIDVTDLFNYLKTKGFYNIPELYDKSTSYYLENINFNEQESLKEYLKTLANLHQKTSYTKLMDISSYDNIYNHYNDLISYFENMFLAYLISLEEKEINKPDELYFMSNYSYLNNNLKTLKKTLDTWYEGAKENLESRVAIIQNKISIDHFIMNEFPVIINFDHYKTDTPLIDLVAFIKLYYDECDIKTLVKEYLLINPLNKEELSLLNIMLMMPSIKEFSDKDTINIQNLVKEVNYLKKMDNLLSSITN